MVWKPLTDREWAGRQLAFRPGQFRAYVQQAEGLEGLSEREAVMVRHFLEGARPAAQRAQRVDPGRFAAAPPFGENGSSYTYVALALGPLIWFGSAHWRLHVTIAYLPRLSHGEFVRFEQRCIFVVETWQGTAPIARPMAIVGAHSRGVYIGNAFETEREGILTMAPDQIERELQAGSFRLVTSHIDPVAEPIRYATEVRRLLTRDSRRLREATVRAAALNTSTQEEVLVRPERGLDPRLAKEVRDLCAYLQDVVVHWPGAQWSMDRDTIQPCILDSSSWHVSRQDEWELVFDEYTTDERFDNMCQDPRLRHHNLCYSLSNLC